VRDATHWARTLHTRMTSVSKIRAEFKQKASTGQLFQATPFQAPNMDPSVFAGALADLDDGEDDATGDAAQMPPLGERSHLRPEGRGSSLVDIARLWTDADWGSASRVILGRLISTPHVPQDLLDRAIASLSADEPPPRTDDKFERLLEALSSQRGRRGYGAGVNSDEEDEEDEMVGRKRSGRERRLALHKSHPGLLTKRTLKEIVETSGAAWALGAGEMEKLMTRLKSTPLTSFPALFRLHANRSEISRGNNVRNKRELQTVTLALDLIVGNQPAAAADVLCQRLKALELAHLEQKWETAELLELIHPEQGLLADREELMLASKELAAQTRFRRGGYQGYQQQQQGGHTQPKKGGGAAPPTVYPSGQVPAAKPT